MRALYDDECVEARAEGYAEGYEEGERNGRVQGRSGALATLQEKVEKVRADSFAEAKEDNKLDSDQRCTEAYQTGLDDGKAEGYATCVEEAEKVMKQTRAEAITRGFHLGRLSVKWPKRNVCIRTALPMHLIYTGGDERLLIMSEHKACKFSEV